MTIKVTAEHIYYGWREHCFLCPIARAIHDATGKPTDVVKRTPAGNWQVWFSGSPREIPLPPDEVARIEAYDRGDGMEPHTFELPVER